MTEAEWLASDDPQALLRWVTGRQPISEYSAQMIKNLIKPNARKLRLFACACCRQVPHLLNDRNRRAVGYAERAADHLDGPEMFAGKLSNIVSWGELTHGVAWMDDGSNVVNRMLERLQQRAVPMSPPADLLRHVVGNPFHLPDPPPWREKCHNKAHQIRADVLEVWPEFKCNDCRGSGHIDRPPDAILFTAQALYDGDQRSAGILADALTDYADGHPADWKHRERMMEFAEHFRREGHPKGCWVLDLILGKE